MSVFLDLQTQGCPGYPTPTDFYVVSEAWHDVPPSLLQYPSLFVTLDPHQEGEASAFGGTPKFFDFLDPETGIGVSPIEL